MFFSDKVRFSLHTIGLYSPFQFLYVKPLHMLSQARGTITSKTPLYFGWLYRVQVYPIPYIFLQQRTVCILYFLKITWHNVDA